MSANDSQSRLGAHPFLIVLGVISTSLLTILGIWGDEEIHVHSRPKRLVSSIENIQPFNESLKKVIKSKLTDQICRDPYDFFSDIKIAGSLLTPVSGANFWHQKLPNLEQEALRRCQAKRESSTFNKSCFIFSPNRNTEGRDFLSGRFVFIELNFSFRNASTKRGLSCKEGILLRNSLLTVYYTLYWPDENTSLSYQRATGGFDTLINRELEARNELR